LNKSIFNIVFAIVIIFSATSIFGQKNNKIPKEFCISNDEHQLFENINVFLAENGKKKLSLSKSLSFVAKTHINDLQINHPDTSICNLSSWSDNGNWTSCCYNSYVPNPDCMWNKPKELTNFKYRGYEMVLFFEDEFNPDSIMQLLYSSNNALAMLLAKDDYSSKKWICMGVGINENYTSIWMAQRADNAGTPDVCKNSEKAIAETNEKPANKEAAKFYIISASFTNNKDAKEAIKRLKQNGFSDAGILKSGTNLRVYLKQLPSLKEAMHFKQNLPYTYNDAWILKE
jgi:hypothetical protein